MGFGSAVKEIFGNLQILGRIILGVIRDQRTEIRDQGLGIRNQRSEIRKEGIDLELNFKNVLF
jgi:hypothetical protein